jgi:hypothetical protein
VQLLDIPDAASLCRLTNEPVLATDIDHIDAASENCQYHSPTSDEEFNFPHMISPFSIIDCIKKNEISRDRSPFKLSCYKTIRTLRS